ncbi:hypothetical protein HZC30_00050 [Candidatus Woesearchaeota archaeon]|nr:hypothetical protein [Candidatus Woesearchaeota archaeon]
MVYEKNRFIPYFPKEVIFTLEESNSNTCGGCGECNLTLGAELELMIEPWKNLSATKISICAGYWFREESERVGASCSDLYLEKLDMPLPKYGLAQIVENIRCGKALLEKDVPLKHPYLCVIGEGGANFHYRVDDAESPLGFSPDKIIQEIGEHYQEMEKHLGWRRFIRSGSRADSDIHEEELSGRLLKLCNSYGLRDERSGVTNSCCLS